MSFQPEFPDGGGQPLDPPSEELEPATGPPGRRGSRQPAPHVRLGRLQDRSLAPAFYAIIERGVRRRPSLAADLLLEVEIKVEGPYPPVRVEIGPRTVLVEDGAATDPQVRIEGGLTDLVSLLVAPVGIGGIPSVVRPAGRRAIGKLALGHVRVEGRLGLVRRLLALIHI